MTSGESASLAPRKSQTPQTNSSSSRRFAVAARGIAAFALLAYFLQFNWDSLSVYFQPDDMMNAARYFRMLPLDLFLAQIMPWRCIYRPLGGYFYLPLFAWFGFDPKPFHIASLAIIAVTLVLLYAFARLLGCAELPSALAVLLGCYHLALAHLYFNLGFTYDVLVGLFYLAVLVWYVSSRRSGRILSPLRIGVFLILLLSALDAKEMALTLPLVITAAEYALFRLPSSKDDLAPGLRGPAVYIALAGILDVAALYGLFLSPNALAAQSGYRPAFTLARLLAFQRRQFSEILFLPPLTPVELAGLWSLLVLAA